MREWAVAALDLVFPARCAVCEVALGAGRRDPLCGDCWAAIERIAPPLCDTCGLPFSRFEHPTSVAEATSGIDVVGVPNMAPHTPRRSDRPGGLVAPLEQCGQCVAAPPGFDWARAGGVYAGPLREALLGLKFARKPALARPLAALVLEQWGTRLRHVDAVLPVPLARARERQRGYNQAALLAERLARGLGARLRPRWLARTRDTAPQTDLDIAQRRANVRGAFVTSSAVAGREVVLVDDVLTTGATASECARVLRAAGAARVGLLTVARVL